MNIDKLLHESTLSADIATGRPELLSLTRAVDAMIYSDLVAIQPTALPAATLFGLRYLNEDGEMSFSSPATYSGTWNKQTAKDLPVLDGVTIAAGQFFKDKNNAVWKALKEFKQDNPLWASLNDDTKLMIASITGVVRQVGDAMTLAQAEDPDSHISPTKFELDKWRIETRSRKFKTAITHELTQDLDSSGWDAGNVIGDMLSTTLSEEINKDILQKLQIVSKRHESIDYTGVLDLSGVGTDPSQGRELYRNVCEMASKILSETTFAATYCVCSPKVAGILSSSGWLADDPSKETLFSGVLKNGLKVYIDTYTKSDYIIVGNKHTSYNDLELVGSLFYAPYKDVDDVGCYTVVPDYMSFNNHVLAMARYGLSTNPYTSKDDAQEQIYQGDDWDNLVGKSKYSRILGVIL